MSAREIEVAAARWLVRREEPSWSAREEAALKDWMDAAMAHKAAFWRLEHAWRQADRIAALGLGSSDTWQGAAPADDVEGNVVPFPVERRSWMRTASDWLRRRPASIAAALALVFLTTWFLVNQAERSRPADPEVAATASADPPANAAVVATQVGRRKIVSLSDGSRIELNTATRIRTSMNGPVRQVWLDQGEAYFDVQHIDGREFVVHAGPQTITVLGTKFSVLRDGDTVRVSVVQGRVRVDEPGRGALRSTIILPGDIIVARERATLVREGQPDQVSRDLAWREGMISFRQSTLGEAAAQFNRYNDRKLEIADADAAAIRLGGTFRASDVEAFARLLHDAYGLKFAIEGDRIIISNR